MPINVSKATRGDIKMHVIRIIAIGISTFLFFACATNQPASTDVSDSAPEKNKITFITSENNNWCKIASSCRYIGEDYCTKEAITQNDAKKYCLKKLAEKAAKNGGDTFIIQDSGVIKYAKTFSDGDEYYRTYGSIYNCSNKNTVNTSTKQEQGSHLVYYSKKYFNQCKPLAKCKDRKPFSIRTSQYDPFKNTLRKITKTYHQYTHIVIDKELINNMLLFRIYATPYQCN